MQGLSLEEASMILPLISPVDLATVETRGQYVLAKHLEELNSALLKVASGEIKRLAVFMPPRHGKSELISKYFPAWYLGTNPDKRIILTSYEADFAASWGKKVREILREFQDVYNIRIDDKSAARNRWDIAGHDGGMGTSGVGGAITGKGASILIIDDPVKNAEQANSQTYRDRAKDWYRSTAYTRLEPDGAVILIQTRWHEDDLGGWLLEEGEDEWTIINLPAINEQGEALWADRFSVERLQEIKAEIGEYWFSAMYQQKPQPPEGGILKRHWIKYYTPEELKYDSYHIYQGWDLAVTEKSSADYTCNCTVAVNPKTNDIYVLDWTREHIDGPTQVSEVIKQYDKHDGRAALVGIETVAYQGTMPAFVLKERILPIKPIPRVTDKVIRITKAFTHFENGKVYLPKGHPLLNEFENEFVHFPRGTHDDLLDATEIAITLAATGSNPYTESEKTYEYSKRGGESGASRFNKYDSSKRRRR